MLHSQSAGPFLLPGFPGSDQGVVNCVPGPPSALFCASEQTRNCKLVFFRSFPARNDFLLDTNIPLTWGRKTAAPHRRTQQNLCYFVAFIWSK